MRIKRLVAVLIFLAMFSALAGCSSISRIDLIKAKTGYITDIGDMRILVNDTCFSANKNTEVVSEKGKQMKFTDLAIGVRVEPWFEGGIRESFPAQADVKKIVVITDKDSEQMQTAVKAIVDYARANYGNTVVFQETQVSKAYFQVTIAGVTLENPNPITIRYDFETKQILKQ